MHSAQFKVVLDPLSLSLCIHGLFSHLLTPVAGGGMCLFHPVLGGDIVAAKRIFGDAHRWNGRKHQGEE